MQGITTEHHGKGVRGDMSIEKLIQRDVRTIAPDAGCADAASLMRDANVGCLVVDDDECLCGILTLDDLVMHLGDTLAHIAPSILNAPFETSSGPRRMLASQREYRAANARPDTGENIA